MPRLFTALEIPAFIVGQLHSLAQPLPGAKWLDEALLHITLRFAGDMDTRAADDFIEAISSISGSFSSCL